MRSERTFIELPAFTRLVAHGDLSDEQVVEIQDGILNGGGKTESGTGGVRKIRCGGSATGKSGGWRVLFADYDQYDVTVLIWAFPKNKQAALTGLQRKVIKDVKVRLDEEIKVMYAKE